MYTHGFIRNHLPHISNRQCENAYVSHDVRDSVSNEAPLEVDALAVQHRVPSFADWLTLEYANQDNTDGPCDDNSTKDISLEAERSDIESTSIHVQKGDFDRGNCHNIDALEGEKTLKVINVRTHILISSGDIFWPLRDLTFKTRTMLEYCSAAV